MRLFIKIAELPDDTDYNHYYLKLWPFLKKTGAITLYPLAIFHRDPEPTAEVIFHEEDHWHLASKLGFWKHYGSYLNEWRKVGYWKNKYEVRARRIALEKLNREG